MYDIVIKNGRIIDGTGTPWFYGDVAVNGGRITNISRHIKERGRRIIDADGNIVCPGFIDIHTHSDIPLLVNPKSESKIYQGVTLEVGGNCGISSAPVFGQAKDRLGRELWEDYGLRIKWDTYDEFLRAMEEEGISVNYAGLIGHGSIRKNVMGYRKSKPFSWELEQIGQLLDLSLKQGAFGFSTGLIYPPGSYADTEEIVFLAKIAAANGRFYATHIRDEGEHLIEAVNEAIRIGEEAGVPVHISHHKAIGKLNRGKVKDTLRFMEDARKKGIDATCDLYPYTATSTNLSSIIPDKYRTGDVSELLKKLKDPKERAQIIKETTKLQNKLGSWSDIYISFTDSEKNKVFEGKNLEEIGIILSKGPCEAAFDLIIEEQDKVDKVRFGMYEDDIQFVMKHRLTMIASDGSARAPYGVMGRGKPHPRSYGTFARVLGRYVRGKKLFSLEEAVKKMTWFPAWRLGLVDRGVLKEGNWADITIFDEGRVIDTADYTNPHRYAEGVLYVIVNGTIVLENGEHLGLFPGKTIRKIKGSGGI